MATLGKASILVKHEPNVAFVFADIICHLVAKFSNGTLVCFDSIDKLQELTTTFKLHLANDFCGFDCE